MFEHLIVLKRNFCPSLVRVQSRYKIVKGHLSHSLYSDSTALWAASITVQLGRDLLLALPLRFTYFSKTSYCKSLRILLIQSQVEAMWTARGQERQALGLK